MKCNSKYNFFCLTHHSQKILPFEEDSSLFKDVVHSHVLSVVLKGLTCSCCDTSKCDLVNEEEEALQVAV